MPLPNQTILEYKKCHFCSSMSLMPQKCHNICLHTTTIEASSAWSPLEIRLRCRCQPSLSIHVVILIKRIKMNKNWAHLSFKMMKNWAIQVEKGFKMNKNWASHSFKMVKPCTLYNLHGTCFAIINLSSLNHYLAIYCFFVTIVFPSIEN